MLAASNTGKPDMELYSYGESLLKMDIPPNTVVARYNGEEILFYEVESYNKSIEFSNKGGNAFYKVIRNEAYRQTALENRDASGYNLNVTDNLEKMRSSWADATYDEQERLLDAMCIRREELWLDDEGFIKLLQKNRIDTMLQSKGMGIVNKSVYDNPNLAENKSAIALFKLQEKIKPNTAVFLLLTGGFKMKAYERLERAYMEVLISQADIELCVDENTLSTTVPEIIY